MAQEATEHSNFVMPKVGAVFEVDREFFVFQEKLFYHIIATGPDFVIYHEGDFGKKGKIKAKNLSVDFSGIYPETCVDEMPDAVNRAKLAGIWPLSKGKYTDFETKGFKATYTVKSQSLLRHKARKVPVYWIEGTLDDNGFKSDVSIALKPNNPVALSSQWGDKIKVYRYESSTKENVDIQVVNNKYKLLTGLNLEDFGTCKSLFE